jgi:hypothetical protein
MPNKEDPNDKESMVPMIKEEHSAIKTKPIDTTVSPTIVWEEDIIDLYQDNDADRNKIIEILDKDTSICFPSLFAF